MAELTVEDENEIEQMIALGFDEKLISDIVNEKKAARRFALKQVAVVPAPNIEPVQVPRIRAVEREIDAEDSDESDNSEGDDNEDDIVETTNKLLGKRMTVDEIKNTVDKKIIDNTVGPLYAKIIQSWKKCENKVVKKGPAKPMRNKPVEIKLKNDKEQKPIELKSGYHAVTPEQLGLPEIKFNNEFVDLHSKDEHHYPVKITYVSRAYESLSQVCKETETQKNRVGKVEKMRGFICKLADEGQLSNLNDMTQPQRSFIIEQLSALAFISIGMIRPASLEAELKKSAPLLNQYIILINDEYNVIHHTN